MVKTFGDLFKGISGIVYVRLSPFEQKAYAGAISEGLPNIFRRCAESFFYVVPPLLFGYLVYGYGEREHKRLMRKNPADFANDK